VEASQPSGLLPAPPCCSAPVCHRLTSRRQSRRAPALLRLPSSRPSRRCPRRRRPHRLQLRPIVRAQRRHAPRSSRVRPTGYGRTTPCGASRVPRSPAPVPRSTG
jgi:hypothetical protein